MSVDPRAPAGGDEQAVAAQLAAVVELEHVVLAVAPRGRRLRAERRARCRRGAAPRRAPRPAARARGRARARRRRRAPPRRRGGARPAPSRRRPARRRGRAAGAGRPSSRSPRGSSRRRRARAGPGSAARSASAPVATTTWSAVWRTPSTSTAPVPASRPLPRSRSMPSSGQPALLAGVGVVRDHEVAPGERRLDVDLGGRRRLVRGVHGLARAQQRLRRDARPVRALAADELALDERDAQPALGERAGAVLARRAAAEDDDVVVAAHVGSSSPACSRTMYSAYQSGQSASASPVRASCSPCAAAARLRASAGRRRTRRSSAQSP